MKKTSEDDVPHNGRSGRGTWQAEVPPASRAGNDVQVADREPGSALSAARAALAPKQFTWAAVRNLLALSVTIILLAAGLALAGALMWPKTYAARAEILFPVTQEQPTGFLRQDRSLTTQLVLLNERAVLGPVATEQGRTVEELQDRVDAAVLENSEIIQLEATSDSSQQARQTVQQVVDSYQALIETGPPVLRERLETGLAEVNTALAEAQTALAAQQELVTEGTATAQTLVPLQTAVQDQQSRRQQLQAQLDEVIFAPVAQVLTPPYSVGVVSPRPVFAAVAGGLVGLVLAAVVVAVLTRSWSRT